MPNRDNNFEAVYGVAYFQDAERRQKAFEDDGAQYFDLEEGDLLCFPNNLYHEVYNLTGKKLLFLEKYSIPSF